MGGNLLYNLNYQGVKMSEKSIEEIQTKEDVVRLANEGCLKTFHVSLETLKAALDAKGIPFTKEGLMLLAALSKIDDSENN
jgi:hypothetical protein